MLNYSVRGEANLRTFEAISSGCLLLQEQTNRTVPMLLRPHVEYLPYTPETLPDVIRTSLNDEKGRRSKVRAAQNSLDKMTYEAHLLSLCQQHLHQLLDWQGPPPEQDHLPLQWLLTNDEGCHDIALYDKAEHQLRLGQQSTGDGYQDAISLLNVAEAAFRKADVATVLDAAQASYRCDQIGNPYEATPPDFSWWRMTLETALIEGPEDAVLAWVRARASFLIASAGGPMEPLVTAARQRGPKIPEIYSRVARALAASDDDAAIELLARASELSPRDREVAELLQAALTRKGFGAEAHRVRTRYLVARRGL